MNRRGVIHNLPAIRQAIGGHTNELEWKVNCISAKEFKQAIRKRRVKEDTIFLGLIQKVEEPAEQVEDVAKKYKGKSDLGAVHVWREDMPDGVKAVLEEYEDIFPQELPSGLPPIRMRHEFRIDLEDDTPQSTGHSTISVRSSCKKYISRYNTCSSMGSSTLWTLRMAH